MGISIPTAALLISDWHWLACVCVCAAEYGDYTEDEFGPSSVYLRQLRLLPQQTDAIEMKIMEHHKDHLYDVAHDIIPCQVRPTLNSKYSDQEHIRRLQDPHGQAMHRSCNHDLSCEFLPSDKFLLFLRHFDPMWIEQAWHNCVFTTFAYVHSRCMQIVTLKAVGLNYYDLRHDFTMIFCIFFQ